MKHYIIISIVSILSLTAIVSNSINLLSHSETTVTTEYVSEYEEVAYTIRDYNGRIALFTKNNDKPEIVYDIFTSSLPEGDKEKLRKGITVETEEEAKSLIDDYTS